MHIANRSPTDDRAMWPGARRFFLLVLLLVSFGLRVYRLGDKSVWWDEGLAAWAARQSPADIARWTSADVHPPLYFWLLYLWRRGSGDSEFGLRFLSVIVGVLTVAATWRLGQVVGGEATGALAASLVGGARFAIWWAQEMRMYALAALWAVLTLWAAIRFWDGGRLRYGALYIFLAIAGLYTLYLYVAVLAVVNLVWLVMWWRSKRLWLRWTAMQLGVLVAFSPWAFYALGRIPTWSSATPVTPLTFLKIYWTVLSTGIPVEVERYRWLTTPVLLVFLAGLVGIARTGERGKALRNAGLLLLSVALPAALVYAVSLPRDVLFYAPQLAPRYFFIFAPAFYTLLAWGIATWRWPLRGLLSLPVAAATIYGTWTYYPGRILVDDYKSLAATLRAYWHPGDAVVLYTDKDWPVFAYHYPGEWHKVPYAQAITPSFAAALLSPIWQEHEGVWLVITPYARINDPQGEVATWLQARAVRTTEHRFDDKVLRFYARTEARARNVDRLRPGVRPPHKCPVKACSRFQLQGYELAVHEYRPGDTMHLFLYRRGATDVTLRIGLTNLPRVVTATIPASEGMVRSQVDLIVPPDAPGGRYYVTVGAEAGVETFRLAKVQVRPIVRAATVNETDIAHPLQADFDGIRLLGYDLDRELVKGGDALSLTLYWRTERTIERRYKVFTHLLGNTFNAARGNFLWGQCDAEPMGGARPTTTWRVGEVIEDHYSIPVDADAPPGRYEIEIGLYDPATGARLPLRDEQGAIIADHLVICHVTVE